MNGLKSKKENEGPEPVDLLCPRWPSGAVSSAQVSPGGGGVGQRRGWISHQTQTSGGGEAGAQRGQSPPHPLLFIKLYLNPGRYWLSSLCLSGTIRSMSTRSRWWTQTWWRQTESSTPSTASSDLCVSLSLKHQTLVVLSNTVQVLDSVRFNSRPVLLTWL